MAWEVTAEGMVHSVNRDIKSLRIMLDTFNFRELSKGSVTEFSNSIRIDELYSSITMRIESYEIGHKFGPFPYDDLVTPQAKQGLTKDKAYAFGKACFNKYVTQAYERWEVIVDGIRDEILKSHLL